MAVQTDYNERHAPAFEGMLANAEWLKNVISREVANEDIGFGKVAVQAAGEDTITFPDEAITADPATFVGITVRDQSTAPEGPNVYAENATAGVLTKGVIWVTAGAAVDQGDAVYFTAAGVLTNASSGNTEIVGATWDSSAGSGDLARLRLG